MSTRMLPIGAPAPPFSGLPGTDGNAHSLPEYTSCRALVVVFSCNHCPYVQAYEGRMKAFQSTYGPRGVQLIAINSNDTANYPEDTFVNMVRRAEEQKFNFPYLRDDDQTVAEACGATHTPEFFLFAHNETAEPFRLCYRGKMDDNYQDPAGVKEHYLQDAVEAVLSGKSVPLPETHSIGCTIKWR